MKQYKLITGNSAEQLKQFPDNHFDSIVTDPPYGINFLGKDWDKNTGEEEVYRQCYRVLKPGGHLLAFSAARTYHHLAMAVERSGFQIRDQIMWVYGSGFPKSQDVGKAIERSEGNRQSAKSGAKYSNYDALGGVNTTTCRTCGKNNVVVGSMFKCDREVCDMRERTKPANNEWAGWGTNLKPAHEPIVMAQKPFPDAIYKNVQKWGVGAINVDDCRVSISEEDRQNYIYNMNGTNRSTQQQDEKLEMWNGKTGFSIQKGERTDENLPQGRFPANFIHDGSDEVVSLFPDNCQRFFYQAKVKAKERNVGFDEFESMFSKKQMDAESSITELNDYGLIPNASTIINHRNKNIDTTFKGNTHPTVKPVELMKYLVKLVTPAGGKVLDPFNGSGSTGMACVELGYDYTGIDLDANYIKIATARIDAWYEHTHPAEFSNPLFTIDDK